MARQMAARGAAEGPLHRPVGAGAGAAELGDQSPGLEPGPPQVVPSQHIEQERSPWPGAIDGANAGAQARGLGATSPALVHPR